MQRQITENLLLNLAEHSQILHLALEDQGLKSFDERLTYLGHLAMCARIFKTVYLQHSKLELEKIWQVEKNSYRFGLPNDERGDIVRESWNNLNKSIELFLN
jgi:hypothetical protein